MNIVLLGRPGSGKGTQAELLSKKLKIPHVSTGEIFRENIQNKTELGIESQKYVDSGSLVPDEILVGMVKERMARKDLENGYILEGAPRTLNQGKVFQSMFLEINRKIEKVVYIHLDRDLMVKRISGRWTCKANDHSYHEVYKPTKVPGVCDIDGSPLYQREDQKPEAIELRIKKYENETEPLVGYYKKIGILLEINGDQTIESVQKEIIQKLAY
ncbi:adenylate kinase [Patescibacteria group bacterium]